MANGGGSHFCAFVTAFLCGGPFILKPRIEGFCLPGIKLVKQDHRVDKDELLKGY